MTSLPLDQYLQLSPKERALHDSLYWEQLMNPRRLAFLAALLKMSIRGTNRSRRASMRHGMHPFDLRPVENGFELRRQFTSLASSLRNLGASCESSTQPARWSRLDVISRSCRCGAPLAAYMNPLS